MTASAIFESAWREVVRRPLRGSLAILGVALATTTLVALIALSRGVQANVLEQSSTPFLTIVQVLPAAPRSGASPRALDDLALQEVRAVSHVREALPAVVVPAALSTEGHHASGTVLGITPPGRAPYALAAGRAPSPSERTAAVLTPAGLRGLGLTSERALGLRVNLELRRGDTGSERRVLALRIVGVSADDIPGEIAVVSLPLAEDAQERANVAAMRPLIVLVLAALTMSSCASDPDLAALQRDPAASLRMPDAVDLGHFRGERQFTIEGQQMAFDAHVYGVQLSDADVHAFYDRELGRLGWKTDPLATSPDTVEFDAWGWCKGAMVFRIGIQDQVRAFRQDFYRGQTFKTVFDARIRGRDPARGCPARLATSGVRSFGGSSDPPGGRGSLSTRCRRAGLVGSQPRCFS